MPRWTAIVAVALVVAGCNPPPPATAPNTGGESGPSEGPTAPPAPSYVRAEAEPAEPGDAVVLLILLHGYGSNEQDLLALGPRLVPQARTIALRAPIPLGQGRYAWYPLDWSGEAPRSRDEDVLAAAEDLAAALEALADESGADTVIVGGFSQGAILTSALAIGWPELLDGGLVFSGRPPPAALDEQAASSPIPMFVSHGRTDAVIPFERGEALRERLDAEGADVTWFAFGGAHSIPPAVREQARTWVDDVIGVP